jgi:putative toxin-antitoxin system antitoxin component (TIGR02293 family)
MTMNAIRRPAKRSVKSISPEKRPVKSPASAKRSVISLTDEKKLNMAESKTAGSSPAKQVAVTSAAFPAGSPAITKADIVKELSTGRESYVLLGEVEEITRLPLKTLAAQIYDVTPKTLASYRIKGRHFPKRMTEVSIKLRDLYKKGVELFGNPSRFNTWLSRESAGLGNLQPLDLMGTSTGIDLVYEELLRIEFGAA